MSCLNNTPKSCAEVTLNIKRLRRHQVKANRRSAKTNSTCLEQIRGHFLMTTREPNLSFKVMILFKGEYLRV